MADILVYYVDFLVGSGSDLFLLFVDAEGQCQATPLQYCITFICKFDACSWCMQNFIRQIKTEAFKHQTCIVHTLHERYLFMLKCLTHNKGCESLDPLNTNICWTVSFLYRFVRFALEHLCKHCALVCACLLGEYDCESQANVSQ